MPETAEQIRAAVLTQAWCEKCGFQGHSHGNVCDAIIHPPLFDRCGGVPGLEWEPRAIYLNLGGDWAGAWRAGDRTIPVEHVALLIIGHESRLLAEASTGVDDDLLLAEALASATPVTDLARLHHRLQDSLDQQEKQP